MFQWNNFLLCKTWVSLEKLWRLCVRETCCPDAFAIECDLPYPPPRLERPPLELRSISSFNGSVSYVFWVGMKEINGLSLFKSYIKLTCVEILWGGGDVPIDIDDCIIISLGGDGPHPVDVLFNVFFICLELSVFNWTSLFLVVWLFPEIKTQEFVFFYNHRKRTRNTSKPKNTIFFL